MIDQFSLVLGHALLAYAMLRLVMRDNLDVDPRLRALNDKVQEQRDAASMKGRRAQRQSIRNSKRAGAAEAKGESVD